MSYLKPQPDASSCWRCPDAEIITTSTGEMYVVCPSGRWKGSACLAKLLASMRKSPVSGGGLIAPQWMRRNLS